MMFMCSVFGVTWLRPSGWLRFRPEKQQEKQTELYNCKVRGVPVEGHLYTVVEKQDNTHTFRLRNCATNQEKVVHRNLIMPVNFLPVLADPEDGGSLVSDLTDEAVDESVVGAEHNGLNVLPGCGPDDRTVYWISQLPASTGDLSTSMDDVDGND